MGIAADRQAWAEYLRSVAEPVLVGTPILGGSGETDVHAWVRGFQDEHGNRRLTDPPLLTRLLGTRTLHSHFNADPEDRLWFGEGIDEIVGLDLQGTGSLLIESPKIATIETRTEAELTALHALWNRRAEGAAIVERCLDAARWHVAELQPDNATGLPWAVHVFVELALASGDPNDQAAALFHAEGLVHAASVVLGHPGIRAACILLDASRVLAGESS